MEYGLIGEKLGHSFSKDIHAQLGAYRYELHPLAPKALDGFMRARDFRGINVTIPYKKDVLAYSDEVDERAARIGAANTLVNKEGCLYAYNTDYDGVVYTLRYYGISLKDKTLLILGTGGTSATVQAVAQDMGARQVLLASRSGRGGALTYEGAAARSDVQVVYNCSPAGMYPHNGESLLPLSGLAKLEAVVDAVYNPFKTALLLEAEGLGVKAVNGLLMLVAQAAKASELFTGRPVADETVHEIYTGLAGRLCNVSLIGMPGCGKTSLGKVLARQLGKQFVDLDAVIVERAGMPIPEIFASRGEDAFRDLESEIAAEYGAKGGQVLSTGGGIVKRAGNVAALRQNGPVLFIDCPVEKLAVGKGRPLAKSKQDLQALYEERYSLYLRAADGVSAYHPYFPENGVRLEKAYHNAVSAMVAGGAKKEA